jgi:heat shock protein HslJ
MWGFALGSEPSAEPLSVEQAVASAEAYLAGIEASDLEVAEVMVFDNHAYVEVKDPATGEGAIELLVDPASQRAMLEFGPSMMWNTTYGMHNAARMHGGMMGQAFGPETAPQGEMTVTPEQAAEAAQTYLDEAFAGQTVSDEVETFPGYYTLHVLENGEVVGMMSVNGYTGQVWYHSWHGNLLEMQEFGE